MDVYEFAASLGEIIWQATVADPPSGGYSEGGLEAALVTLGGQFKLIAVPYSNDPWSPANIGDEEGCEIAAAPWLGSGEIRSRIIDAFDVSCMSADAGYLDDPAPDEDDDAWLWPEQAVDAALAAAGCDLPVDEVTS